MVCAIKRMWTQICRGGATQTNAGVSMNAATFLQKIIVPILNMEDQCLDDPQFVKEPAGKRGFTYMTCPKEVADFSKSHSWVIRVYDGQPQDGKELSYPFNKRPQQEHYKGQTVVEEKKFNSNI